MARWAPANTAGQQRDGKLLQAVKRPGPTGQDTPFGLLRELRPIGNHGRGTGEKAIRMRIIRGPQNLVRTYVIRQHVQTVLDRLKGNPAVALKQLAGPGA